LKNFEKKRTMKLVEDHQEASNFIFSYILSTLGGESEKLKKFMQKDSYFKMKVITSKDEGSFY